jgi:hypothetical protein
MASWGTIGRQTGRSSLTRAGQIILAQQMFLRQTPWHQKKESLEMSFLTPNLPDFLTLNCFLLSQFKVPFDFSIVECPPG